MIAQLDPKVFREGMEVCFKQFVGVVLNPPTLHYP